jgi:hypothetical protein
MLNPTPPLPHDNAPPAPRMPGVDCTCGMLSCVCHLTAGHAKECRYRISLLCPVGIECEHGWDVCPICDPCTCGATAKAK